MAKARLQELLGPHEIRPLPATNCHGCDRGDEMEKASASRKPRYRKAVFVLPFFLAAMPGQALAKQDEMLEPITPWHVDWTENTCVMRRGFGSEDKLLLLQIERFGPGDGFQLVVTGPQLRHAEYTERLSITYGEGGYTQKVEYPLYGKAKDGDPTIFISSTALSPGAAERHADSVLITEVEKEVDKISLSWRKGKSLTLATGPLDKAFAALRKCTDDLLTEWGLDPVQQRTLIRPVMPKDSPSKWAHPSDYPQTALTEGVQSLGNFLLLVGADGIPTDCRIQRSYSGDLFDKRTCELMMKRARFNPALDANGQPVPSYYFDTVKWVISY